MNKKTILDYILEQITFDQIIKSNFCGDVLDETPVYSTYNSYYSFDDLRCHDEDGIDAIIDVSYDLKDIKCTSCGNNLDIIEALRHMSILEHDRSEIIHRLVWFFKLDIPDNVILKAFRTPYGFNIFKD